MYNAVFKTTRAEVAFQHQPYIRNSGILHLLLEKPSLGKLQSLFKMDKSNLITKFLEKEILFKKVNGMIYHVSNMNHNFSGSGHAKPFVVFPHIAILGRLNIPNQYIH